MSRDDQRRLLLEQQALDDLRAQIERDSYLTVNEARAVLHCSREKLDAIPFAILPFVDIGLGDRAMKRYHPADVAAAPAKLRAWKRAQDHGQGEVYLARETEKLEARDLMALELAGVA